MRMTADDIHPKLRTRELVDPEHRYPDGAVCIKVLRTDGTHDGTPTLLTRTEALVLIGELASAINRA